MQTQDVIKACAALVRDGKKPTIGLVKAQLTNKVHLATVVKGIQQFKANRQLSSKVVEDNNVVATKIANADKSVGCASQAKKPHNAITCGCEERVLLLEQQIAKLNHQLIDLQTLVQGLSQP